MVLIRQYDPTADYSALRACFIELQTWEQNLEPGLPAPEDAADPDLAEVFRNCAENSGRIFLAEADGAVVGFICVLAKVLPSADDGIAPMRISRIWSCERPIAAAASVASLCCGLSRLRA